LQSGKKKSETIHDLFLDYQKNCSPEIREKIIEYYFDLPKILSRKYVNRGVEFDDLLQVARIGLLNAVDRFDPDMGKDFLSYATPTILGEIKRYFRDKQWVIKVPRKIQEQNIAVNKAREELTKSLMRSPKVEEIAGYLNISREEVIEAIEGSYAYAPKSLDSEISSAEDEEQGLTLLDVIGEEDREIQKFENEDFINNLLSNLNEVEKLVITERFFARKSQCEVAGQINVSQMTVSRLEKKALQKLRKIMESR
jgi:RNA polymerase sigma-B factor